MFQSTRAARISTASRTRPSGGNATTVNVPITESERGAPAGSALPGKNEERGHSPVRTTHSPNSQFHPFGHFQTTRATPTSNAPPILISNGNATTASARRPELARGAPEKLVLPFEEGEPCVSIVHSCRNVLSRKLLEYFPNSRSEQPRLFLRTGGRVLLGLQPVQVLEDRKRCRVYPQSLPPAT